MIKVEWGLEGQTNVDEVTDKTKKGLDGIEKNAKRVGDAFGMSMSSIFLKFLGPMALLQTAISWISSAIDDMNQKSKDATDLAINGESKYVSAETSYLARKQKAYEDDKKEQELARIATEKQTQDYIEDGNGIKVMNKMGVMGWLKYGLARTGYAAQQKDVQNAVAELAAEEMSKEVLKGEKSKDFKGPEGFSNVVGVGPSPVLDALTQQLDIQREMLIQLEIANSPKASDTNFTAGPSRATPYGL